MAAVDPTYSSDINSPNTQVVKWTPITATNNVGTAARCQNFPDKVVQVLGTFDGNTILMQGSNDGGVTWFSLTSPPASGSANVQTCSFTAAGGKQIIENPQQIRPSDSGGSAGESNTVLLAMH